MKFVIQRVCSASVTVSDRVVGEIGQGLLVLVGISSTDTVQTADKMLKKLIGLRIFEDASHKTNLSLKDVSGSLLLVSQFTLYADCRKGNRPSFTSAGAPDMAKTLYEYLIMEAKKEVPVVQQGIFGEHMQVELLNNGPFTIVLDSEELGI